MFHNGRLSRADEQRKPTALLVVCIPFQYRGEVADEVLVLVLMVDHPYHKDELPLEWEEDTNSNLPAPVQQSGWSAAVP